MRIVSIVVLIFVLGGVATAETQPLPGQPFDYKLLVEPGKYTIVDFYSKHCGPCVRISPLLDQLAAARSEVVIVRLDIDRPGSRGIDWQSPLARQYGLRSIPHFKIHSPDCTLLAEGEAAFRMLAEWIEDPSTVPAIEAASRHRFAFSDTTARSVSVVGTFNDWRIGATPLSRGPGGTWTAEVALGPGRHEYKFVIDKSRLVADPKNPEASDDGDGGKNSIIEKR